MVTSASGTSGSRTHSVRSVKPRNVYGKRTGTAAVLDRASPASRRSRAACESTIDSSGSVSDDLVEAVQEQLAAVTVDDEARHGSYSNDPEKDSKSYTCCCHEEKSPQDPNDSCTTSTTPDSGDANHDRGNSQPEAVAVVVPTQSSSRSRNRPPANVKTRRTPGGRCYVEDQAVQSYARPILEQAVSPVASRDVQQFDYWARAAGDRFRVEKIAEGSYGEVYQLHLSDEMPTTTKQELSQSKFSKLKAYDAGIFKIVPLRAQKGPGSKKFTSVDEIVSEVRLLRLLDPVPGFARFRDVHVVQGRFPQAYQDAWVKYSQNNDDCFNPDPASKKSYPDTQLWAILEMDNAGYELEKFACSSISQIYDIFWNVALGLARAEQLSAFEHRDLHLGNVCVKPRDPEASSACPFVDEESHVQTGFGLSGIETTIIDYSLSRAEFTPAQHARNFGIAWSDLDKKKIFDAVGRDEEEKLLRDTYRRMRSYINKKNEVDDGKRTSKESRQWKSYNPATNLIWLSFVLATLLKRYKSRNNSPPRPPLGERDPNHQVITPKSGKYQASKTVWTPSSTSSTPDSSLLDDDELEDELLERLEAVLDFLDVEKEENEFSCAGDLVATAIGLEWLGESDFLC